jgi:predicted metal-dependent peptidase
VGDVAQARDVIAAARTSVVRKLPYFSTAILSLRPFALPGLGTFGVDAESRMAFDPLMTLTWGVLYCATVVAHEALHILLNHHGRRKGRQPYKWNLAADCECNRILLDAGFRFPDGTTPVTAESLGLPPKLTAEEYYDLISDSQAQALASQAAGRAADGKGKTFPGTGSACGDGAGNPQGWEEKAKELAGGLEGQSAADQRSMRRSVAEAVAAAAAVGGRGIGNVPVGLQVWATLQLEVPVVPWTRVLPSLVRSAIASRSGADDYTRQRVSRRSTAYLGRMPILPALRSPKPEVALVLDFSGSMLGAPVRRAVSEAVGVVKALGLPVRMYAVDTAVHAEAVVVSAKDVEKLNAGGGGTDMVVGIAAADRPKRGSRPDVIILLTDGETPWPTRAQMPRAKLVVGVIGKAEVPAHITRVVRIPRPAVEADAA